MSRITDWLLIGLGVICLAPDWKSAEPGWSYEFPRDHHSHQEFKTEWWYFTGNLFDAAGNRYGYELTFFRQGIIPPGKRDPAASRFIVNDLKFAHFTITDAAGKRFRFDQQTSRGTFGEAGFDEGDKIAWLNAWSLRMLADGTFDLNAESAEAAIRLHSKSAKAPVVHGQNGISAKAPGRDHASHYYSITRLETAGELRLGGLVHSVHGESWFDHEWATNQLAANQVGWNWLCLQFEDDTELILYEMRLENGQIDPASSGTFIAADGAPTFLPGTSFEMKPTEFWTSKASGARYPIGWKVEVPGRQLRFSVRPLLADQELALVPLTYWEGAVDAVGTRGNRAITAQGYLELTGYAGPLGETLSR
jgi:predicted secreted hydrolase